jgi:hypothetical protein
MNEP